MQYTSNYDLNQWEAADIVTRADFNADNAKIDAALKTVATAAANAQSAVSSKGNCTVVCGTYTGTGSSGSAGANQLTFSGMPMLVVVQARKDSNIQRRLVMVRDSDFGLTVPGANSDASVEWGSDSVLWYRSNSADIQMNTSGKVYSYVALLKT